MKEPVTNYFLPLSFCGNWNTASTRIRPRKFSLFGGVALLDVTARILETAAFLVLNKAMPADPLADAVHLSLAAHNECDILLTCNCVHLANRNKLRHLKQLLREADLEMPDVVTPLDLLGLSDEQ